MYNLLPLNIFLIFFLSNGISFLTWCCHNRLCDYYPCNLSTITQQAFIDNFEKKNIFYRIVKYCIIIIDASALVFSHDSNAGFWSRETWSRDYQCPDTNFLRINTTTFFKTRHNLHACLNVCGEGRGGGIKISIQFLSFIKISIQNLSMIF